MRAFSSFTIIVFIIFSLIIIFSLLSIPYFYEKKEEIRLNDLEILINEQTKLVEKAEGITLYCNSFKEYSLNTSLSYNGCNVSYGSFKSKNCIPVIVEKAKDFLRQRNITNSSIDNDRIELENYLKSNGFSCSSSKIIFKNNCPNGFEVVCNAGKVETNSSFKEEYVYIRGGVS